MDWIMSDLLTWELCCLKYIPVDAGGINEFLVDEDGSKVISYFL